jgi:alpha-beta hydrolase superfamily lysophospholipase
MRELIFREVQEKIELVWLRHINGNGKKLFVVAHSFGTLAVIRALQMHIPKVPIEGLVLLGSIVPRSHYWDGLIRNGQLRHPPLAIIRPLDLTVRFANKVGGEDSGATGFIANGQYRVRQKYKIGGHTAYFPDDVDDVVTVLKSGVTSVQSNSYQDWKRSRTSYGAVKQATHWMCGKISF